MRQLIRFINNCESIFVFLVFTIIFLAGLYSLIDTYLVYNGAADTSILKYKPGYDGPPPDKEIEGTMAGWLTMDDTGIDYPVMQGKTNEEYLNKDPYGDYSLSGSIFLDSRNSTDFSDDYSLIYGHHMEGGAMFGPLHKYLKQDFFKSHKTGTLTVKEKAHKLHAFSVLRTEATDPVIFSPTESTSEAVLEETAKTAVIKDKADMKKAKGKKLVALSTCQYPDTVYRIVVICFLD